jgi:hypothetical protein
MLEKAMVTIGRDLLSSTDVVCSRITGNINEEDPE